MILQKSFYHSIVENLDLMHLNSCWILFLLVSGINNVVIKLNFALEFLSDAFAIDCFGDSS